MEKPTQLKEITLDALREACQEYLDFLEGEDYIEDRLHKYEHYIFEVAVEAIYGENIFKWVTQKMNEHDEEKEKKWHPMMKKNTSLP